MIFHLQCIIHRTVFKCWYSFSYLWLHITVTSNYQPYHCLLSRLFRCRSKKTSQIRVTGLCAGNSPVTGEFPAEKASNAEIVSIWWCLMNMPWSEYSPKGCLYQHKHDRTRSLGSGIGASNFVLHFHIVHPCIRNICWSYLRLLTDLGVWSVLLPCAIMKYNSVAYNLRLTKYDTLHRTGDMNWGSNAFSHSCCPQPPIVIGNIEDRQLMQSDENQFSAGSDVFIANSPRLLLDGRLYK